MSLIYADSSALIRAYFPDEAQLVDMRTLLLEGKDAVVTSEIARLELASAGGGGAGARSCYGLNGALPSMLPTNCGSRACPSCWRIAMFSPV